MEEREDSSYCHFMMRVIVNIWSSSDAESEGDRFKIILDSLNLFFMSNVLVNELPSFVFECRLAVVL